MRAVGVGRPLQAEHVAQVEPTRAVPRCLVRVVRDVEACAALGQCVRGGADALWQLRDAGPPAASDGRQHRRTPSSVAHCARQTASRGATCASSLGAGSCPSQTLSPPSRGSRAPPTPSCHPPRKRPSSHCGRQPWGELDVGSLSRGWPQLEIGLAGRLLSLLSLAAILEKAADPGPRHPPEQGGPGEAAHTAAAVTARERERKG